MSVAAFLVALAALGVAAAAVGLGISTRRRHDRHLRWHNPPEQPVTSAVDDETDVLALRDIGGADKKRRT